MIINTDAIVLHRMKYKNSGLIARIFTKHQGKISIIINGASKQKGNMFGVIEPPNIIKLNYYQKKSGGLQVCKDANFLSNNLNIKQDILTLSSALAIVEIIDKTLHENDSNVEIYQLAENMLHLLNMKNINPKLIITYFLFHIIKELGFMLELHEKSSIDPGNQDAKKILIKLNQCPANQLIQEFDNHNIEWMDIIIYLEGYIMQHLKLTQKIKSLNMIKHTIYEK